MTLKDHQKLLEFNQAHYAKAFFDYLTYAIVILICIIRIEQDLFDNSPITNSSHTVANLRTEAISYLEKAATETIETSNLGGLITKNMAKGVEELREKMLNMLKENGNGCFRLPNSSRHFRVTCNEKSNSSAGKCMIGKKGQETISVDVTKYDLNTMCHKIKLSVKTG